MVILGLSERAGYKIRFVEFLKYGSIVTSVTITLSALYLWVRYFILA